MLCGLGFRENKTSLIMERLLPNVIFNKLVYA